MGYGEMTAYARDKTPCPPSIAGKGFLSLGVGTPWHISPYTDGYNHPHAD